MIKSLLDDDILEGDNIFISKSYINVFAEKIYDKPLTMHKLDELTGYNNF